MQLKSYPRPCPSIPFPQTCCYEMKVEEAELPTARAGLQPQHPAFCCSSQSERAAPPTASDSAKCWQVSKGSNCRWKKADKYLLQPSRNTQERAACTSIQNLEHTKRLNAKIYVDMQHLPICRRPGTTSSFLPGHWKK